MVKVNKILTILFLFLLQGHFLNAQSIESTTLNGNWELYYGPYSQNDPTTPDDLKTQEWQKIPATVPGNVELDLLASGIIKNPEIGNNIYNLRKYEAYQWWYYRIFETPEFTAGEHVELVFEGLDCFGTVWVNDKLVAKTDNMLIAHRFDITDLLAPAGNNSIYIRIDPAVYKSQEYINGVIGGGEFRVEQLHIRKAPHMYGWDIMPRLISAGLWRDVHLDIKKPTRIEQIYWMTTEVDVSLKEARLILDCQISTDYPTLDELTMEVTLKRGSKTFYENSYSLLTHWSRKEIYLDNVDFWWPKGYGNPALYDATVRIVDKKKKVLDEKKQKIGIRTAELINTGITTRDNPGEFVFKINGEKIFVRGTNWVPLDALHSRDKEHLKDAIQMIVDLNCNMIRCWGGNVYEDNDFFDFCDENGIMVWQDFSMACTMYPLDNEFIGKIKNEAVDVVLKLRHHPSLVLWSGNNENDQSVEWTFRNQSLDPGMDIISREVLPRVIWEYDPIRNYLPSSPYYSEKFVKQGFDHDMLTEVHLWGPRGYYKAPFYTDVNAHFVSEIGYHGCPNRNSLEQMFYPEYVYPWINGEQWNDQWQAKAVRSHPKSSAQIHRNDLMMNQVKALFGDCPKDLDQFIFASQATQAEAMKFFVELWRMDKFRKTGIIWWNLRDGWPIISDAVVDFYNSKKLAYYYIKQVQHDACVMIGDAKDEKYPVIAVNDTREQKSGIVTVRDADTGKALFLAEFDIPVNGKTLIGYIPEKQKQSMWLIDYMIGKENYTNHYLAGEAPFKLEDYQRWYKKLNIKRD